MSLRQANNRIEIYFGNFYYYYQYYYRIIIITVMSIFSSFFLKKTGKCFIYWETLFQAFILVFPNLSCLEIWLSVMN